MSPKLDGDQVGRINTKIMDRIYNNEAFVGYVILLLLKVSDMDMARLAIVVPLLVNDKIRNRLSKHKENPFLENVLHCYASLTLNRIYREMLVIEINSLVMLSQADLIFIKKSKISLTEKGSEMLKDIRQVNSNRLKGILIAQNSILYRVNEMSTEQLYKALNIQL